MNSDLTFLPDEKSVISFSLPEEFLDQITSDQVGLAVSEQDLQPVQTERFKLRHQNSGYKE